MRIRPMIMACLFEAEVSACRRNPSSGLPALLFSINDSPLSRKIQLRSRELPLEANAGADQNGERKGSSGAKGIKRASGEPRWCK